MEDGAAPARAKQKIVNDEHKDLRREIKAKAKTLLKYVHFEATMQPHRDKLSRDIDVLVKQLDEYEAKIADLRTKIGNEKQQIANARTEPFTTDHTTEIREITQLEELYEGLLAEKQRLLQAASQ